jgi:hypothetical protein
MKLFNFGKKHFVLCAARVMVLVSVFVFLSSVGLAQESSRNWGLRATLDKDTLTLELKGPLDGLVAFNRRPGNSNEKAELEGAMSSLKSAAALFDLPQAAGCELGLQRLTSDVQERRLQEEPGKPPKLQHQGTAGVIHATYGARCAVPKALTTFKVHLFKVFPAIKVLVYERVRKGKTERTEHTSTGTSLTLSL